jgi:hypothetical protein
MEKDHLSRKLAVLLHVDVVGSNALVQQNETLAARAFRLLSIAFPKQLKTIRA